MTTNDKDETCTLAEILKTQLFKSPRQPLHSAYLLFAKALFPLLARYLRRQQIRFKASAPLDMQKRVIFLCPDLEESKKTLPRFVLSYLQELPRCELFYQPSPPAGTNRETTNESAKLLVEYGFKHPLPATEIAQHLPTKSLYFMFGDQQRPALVIDPAPPLKDDCDLSKPESCIEKLEGSLEPTTTSTQPPLLQLKLRLIDDPQAREPTRALYLESKELNWLETLWQRLPGPLLAGLRWAGDQTHGILLLPEDEELSLFPFAEPLKKVKSNLFVPLKQKLSLQLTDTQLESTLALAPEKLTFLTRQWRFDIAEKRFQPLNKMITASTATSTTLKFSDLEEPFDFVWQNHDNVIEADEIIEKDSLKSQATETADRKPSPLTITKSQKNTNQAQIAQDSKSTTPTEILKKYALLLRRQNDFLGAATCFSLAEEPLPAAECYRLAALSLEQQ